MSVQIDGKVLLFTDLHVGLKSGSETRLNEVRQVVQNICDVVKKNSIKHVVFLGDWHHTRQSIDVKTLNVSYELVNMITNLAHFHVILGNHDAYNKNSVDVNSMKIFQNNTNLTVYDTSSEVYINGVKSLFVPWKGIIDQSEAGTYKFLMGHFDVDEKYFQSSSFEDSNKVDMSTSDNIIDSLDLDDILSDKPKEESKEKQQDNNVGDFIDIAKENGTIFSGHIHHHKESVIKNRNFIFIGSPYQQNFGEMGMDCGYYIIDENNNYKFHTIDETPKHIKLIMSQILADVSSFDFGIVKNNIIRKVYDIDVDHVIDVLIQQKINDNKPFEEDTPDYIVSSPSIMDSVEVTEEDLQSIRKSKLEYISRYVEKMDQKVLDDDGITKNDLMTILTESYNRVENK